ncbi:Arginase/deacetylase [Ophiobolus disseminans]|uniref:Arginase/deacetylase n=1 Tax=Ophiobolus disseminans TaxID=1469910 RepID=A0A6A6ZUI6_9PLEO|nr:Arginase/deacetylase [Ophiobolus disseminans]
MPAPSPSVAITYVPADCGSLIPGKSKAPQAFRDAGIVQALLDAGVPLVAEHEALATPALWDGKGRVVGGVRDEERNVGVCVDVEGSLLHHMGSGTRNGMKDEEGGLDIEETPFQLILGGECSMLPGILSALHTHFSPLRIGLVYIDADTDLSSPLDSTSGTFAGMNMCHLLRTPGALDAMRRFGKLDGAPMCDERNTVFFATNMRNQGNSREHFSYLFEHGFKVVPAAAVARDSQQCARDALAHLDQHVDVILVHLDIDAIDAGDFPLANVPQYTGARFEHVMSALEVFVGCEKVGALCVAEGNPDHDPGLGMVRRLVGRVGGIVGGRWREEAVHIFCQCLVIYVAAAAAGSIPA